MMRFHWFIRMTQVAFSGILRGSGTSPQQDTSVAAATNQATSSRSAQQSEFSGSLKDISATSATNQDI